jgi:hypothetical protein
MITITENAYKEHANNYDGYCLACKEFTEGGCEPDMRRGECEGCGEQKVYGTEELLMMGLITFKED